MNRICFDTHVFIYIFEGLEPMRSQLIGIRRRMIERGDQIITSTMTLGELLVKLTKLGQVSSIEHYVKAIRSTARVVSFDASIAWPFACLRASQNLRSADAIQLACAAHGRWTFLSPTTSACTN